MPIANKKRIRKTAEVTALSTGAIVNSLESNSTTDAPSIKVVKDIDNKIETTNTAVENLDNRLTDSINNSKWAVERNINGMGIDGSSDRFNYGECTEAGNEATKTVECNGFKLATGAEITVRFSNANTAVNPTLKVGKTDAKQIRYNGSAKIDANLIKGTHTYTFRYTGVYWDIIGEPQLDYWFTTDDSGEGIQDRITNRVNGFSLYPGCEAIVTFSKTVTNTSPKLNVSGTGLKYMYYKGAYIPPYLLQAGHTYTFKYDGTYWQLIGSFFENIGGDIVSRTSTDNVITLDNKGANSRSTLIDFKKNGTSWGSLGFTSAGILKRVSASGDSSFKIHDAKSIQSGKVVITPKAANETTSHKLTFPIAFSSVPAVVVCADSSAPSTTLKGVTVYSPTTTSVEICLNRNNTTATTIYWVAVE